MLCGIACAPESLREFPGSPRELPEFPESPRELQEFPESSRLRTLDLSPGRGIEGKNENHRNHENHNIFDVFCSDTNFPFLFTMFLLIKALILFKAFADFYSNH
jgi:hypothetical protein